MIEHRNYIPVLI